MIVAGFGFQSSAGLPSLRAAFVLAQDCLTSGHRRVTHLATAADKMKALAPLASELGLPVRAMPPELLAGMATATWSGASFAVRGTGSVAEASALAAIAAHGGQDAQIIVARRISPDRMATCAIAQGTLA